MNTYLLANALMLIIGQNKQYKEQLQVQLYFSPNPFSLDSSYCTRRGPRNLIPRAGQRMASFNFMATFKFFNLFWFHME